jgi:peptidoglycan/LPS O-acetylase OafA/YrhL
VSGRSRPIDGIRALAALSVLTFHVWLYRVGEPPGTRTTVFDKALFEASLGLICFFVLSGFLLYRPFARAALRGGEPVAIGRYALRRAARIVPAYYVCLLGCIVLFSAVGLSRLLPAAETLPLFAVFGQNYSMDTVMKINPVTWSLGVEAAFYVVLPVLGLIAFLLGPRRAVLQAAILIGLVGVTTAWNVAAPDGGWGALGTKALPAYIGHFALGMLLAMCVEWRSARSERGPLAGTSTAVLVAAGFALVVGSAYWHETSGSFTLGWLLLGTMPAALGFALVVGAAAAGAGPAVSWLGTRALAGLGIVSYGIYLWHLPVILVVREVGLLPSAFAPRFLVVFFLAVGAATLSWMLVERPVLRRVESGRGRTRPERPRRRGSGPVPAKA